MKRITLVVVLISLFLVVALAEGQTSPASNLRPQPGTDRGLVSNFTMARADLCVDIVNPRSLPDPADEDAVGSVGVWFWGTDLQNFYTATITLDGKAEIDRLNRGAWQIVVAPTPASSIKTAPGAVNEVEIVTNNAKAAFYVNGALVTEINGRPPEGGGSPGIYGESGPNGTTWIIPRARLY